jgi:hypothetical protein
MPLKKRLEPIVLENRRILFRNFAGEEGRFNAKGDRNFNVVLDASEAVLLQDDGWNVKYLKPREEGDDLLARLEVAVHFGKNPPRIILITSKGKTPLEEDMVGLLDWVEIANVDMIIRPYSWDVNGRQGVKAYLKSIYVTIREDELERKYSDVPDYPLPDSAQSAIQMSSEILSIERGNEDAAPF